MLEIDCQSMVIDIVRARGGYAHKLSNRFLIGVADLSIQIPGLRHVWAEVKLNKFRQAPFEFGNFKFKLDVTRLQHKFLYNYQRAGAKCGILSFVEIGGRGKLGLHVAWLGLDTTCRYEVEWSAYQAVNMSATREEQLWTMLRQSP